jgi:predicted SnoaL-like aldol condensation-catalyzing enzyme
VVDVFRVADGLIAEHWDLREDVPESTVSGNDIV